MNILFRVDSSMEIGLGHLMRCLALADELKQQSHNIIFICRELTGNLITLIEYPVFVLSKNDNFQSDDVYLNWLGATQEQDAQQTIEVIPANVDFLIVDSYALDEIWHNQLRIYVKKIMVIDDLADRKFNCDVLLNQNLGSQKSEYENKVSGNCEFLLGCDYALLRPEFSKLRAQALEKRIHTKEIKNIFISLGGSDIDNISYDILRQLDDRFNIVVVLGGASPHNIMIKDYAKGKNIKVVVNASNMAEIMFNADLAIGAGGSASWERCCLGLPTLLYVLADNQKEISENLGKLGAVIIVRNLKNDLQNLLNDFSLWRSMSREGSNICNGLGCIKVSAHVK